VSLALAACRDTLTLATLEHELEHGHGHGLAHAHARRCGGTHSPGPLNQKASGARQETSEPDQNSKATPAGCAGSESYVWFDPQARVFVERREAINVAWFATAGILSTARTGRVETEGAATDSTNDWLAPSSPADVWLWMVIRDSRGGVGWSTYRVRVE